LAEKSERALEREEVVEFFFGEQMFIGGLSTVGNLTPFAFAPVNSQACVGK